MDIKSVIEKVQKLQALSAKSSNINEALAASKAANKLIDEHRLSEAELEIQGQQEEPTEEDEGFIYESGKVTYWKTKLVNVLVEHYGLATWVNLIYPAGRKVSRYKLVGRKSDITVAKYMFSWLVLECQRLSDLEVKGRGRVFIASYCEGFVEGIRSQLATSRNEVKQVASTAAIVKIDARSKEAEIFMYSKHKNLRPGKGFCRQVNDNAFTQGKIQGKSLHLGHSLNDSRAPRLLKK